jgi:hypothetical protein
MARLAAINPVFSCGLHALINWTLKITPMSMAPSKVIGCVVTNTDVIGRVGQNQIFTVYRL